MGDRLCQTCYGPAARTCDGCKDTFYCSSKCHKFGWSKGGHKLVCKGPSENRKLQKILLKLFRAEHAFYKSFSRAQKVLLAECHGMDVDEEEAETITLNHFSKVGQIALCIVRANACCMISTPKPVYWKEFVELYHANVTKKWLKKNKTFLEELGFEYQFVCEEVYVNNLTCGCDDHEGNKCNEDAPVFSNGLLVKDQKSPLIETVNKAFVEKAHTEVSFEDVMSCIAFMPINTGQTRVKATYYFEQGSKVIFGDSNLCCSPCFSHEYVRGIPTNGAKALGNHFWKCYVSMKKVGFLISLQITDDNDEWPDEAYATAWLAAAGGDHAWASRWIDKSQMIRKGGMEKRRVTTILALMGNLD